MNIKENLHEHIDHITSYSKKYSCNDCLELTISLLKHQLQFHSNLCIEECQNDLLQLLQSALTAKSGDEFDYNITISVIKIPIDIKSEPDDSPNYALYDDKEFSVEWLEEELPTKSQSEYVNVQDFIEIDQTYQTTVAKRTYQNDHFEAKCQSDNVNVHNFKEIDQKHQTAVKKRTYQNDHLIAKPTHSAENQSENAAKRKRRHPNSGRKPNPLTCDLCGLIFSKNLLILRHMRKMHIDKSGNCYKCGECNAEFTRLMFKRAHIREFHPEKKVMREKKISEVKLCDICGKNVKSANYTNHRNTHFRDTLYKCSVCNKSLASFTHLNEHMNTHSGKKIKCLYEKCDREYSHPSGMTRHYKTTHLSFQAYKCFYCSKKYYTKAPLK